MSEWHLDKRVPIALIVTLLVQFGGFTWFAATEHHKNVEQDRRIEDIETRCERISALNDRLIRVEVQLKSINKNVEKVVDKLDHHISSISALDGILEELKKDK